MRHLFKFDASGGIAPAHVSAEGFNELGRTASALIFCASEAQRVLNRDDFADFVDAMKACAQVLNRARAVSI